MLNSRCVTQQAADEPGLQDTTQREFGDKVVRAADAALHARTCVGLEPRRVDSLEASFVEGGISIERSPA